MTKIERELLDKCIELYMTNCEWLRIDEKTGEQFPGQLRQLSQRMEMMKLGH